MSEKETDVSTNLENEQKGTKRPHDKLKVHSVNEWETADLGDDDRKQKFLRLMGAGKKKASGKFVIGDQSEEKHHINEDPDREKKLEDQYQKSLEQKLTGSTRRHEGFGFHKEEGDGDNPEKKEDGDKPEKKEDGDKPEKKEDGDKSDMKDNGDKPEKKEDKNAEIKKSESDNGEKSIETELLTEVPEKKEGKAKMMNFVKSSS